MNNIHNPPTATQWTLNITHLLSHTDLICIDHVSFFLLLKWFLLSSPWDQKQRQQKKSQGSSHANSNCQSEALFYFCEYLLSASPWNEPQVLRNGNYSTVVCFGADVLRSSGMWLWMSDCRFTLRWLQHCLVVTWLEPCETAVISTQVLCTPYGHAPVFSVRCTLFSCNCHLHFWQNGWDLLHATVLTRGWKRYHNKSQHRKLTLENKILPRLL